MVNYKNNDYVTKKNSKTKSVTLISSIGFLGGIILFFAQDNHFLVLVFGPKTEQVHLSKNNDSADGRKRPEQVINNVGRVPDCWGTVVGVTLF